MKKALLKGGLLSLCCLGFWACGDQDINNGQFFSDHSIEIGFGDPTSPNFFVLSDGTDLKKYDQERLQTRPGKNVEFGDAQKKSYQSLKKNEQVYWVVRNLETGAVIAKGKNTETNLYGASVPKIVVAAAALNKGNGRLKTEKLWKALIRLLVDSENNPAWDEMQEAAGGAEGVNQFTKAMGYEKMRAARNGGNSINAIEMTQFYYDVLHGKFKGAEPLFKVSMACNTGGDRARKYAPKNVYQGGKTGTYNESNHDTRYLRVEGKWYSTVVLTTLGKDENVAVMHGGLLREYILGTFNLDE